MPLRQFTVRTSRPGLILPVSKCTERVFSLVLRPRERFGASADFALPPIAAAEHLSMLVTSAARMAALYQRAADFLDLDPDEVEGSGRA
jgi:hypothetical protein